MKYWVSLGLLLVSTLVYANPTHTGGDHPTVTVTTVGYGISEKAAVQDGFRKAIEQAVGTLVISDTEINGDRLLEDRIGNYSSGYVDNYRVLETSQEPTGRYVVKMQVTVGNSHISHRMMTRGEQRLDIDGDRLQAQMSTEFEQRAQGDRLIAQVLDSYPQHAFILNSGQTEFKITNRRAPYVDIPFSITMSPSWVSALNEALGVVAQKSTSCSGFAMLVSSGAERATRIANSVRDLAQKPCGQLPDLRIHNGRSYSYYFYDQETLRLINAEFQSSTGVQRIAIHVDLQNSLGDSVDHRCTDVNTETFIRYNQPSQAVTNLNDRDMIFRPEIAAENKIVGVLNINLRNIQDFSDLAKIKLTVGKTCT
jgi:hypothetical protein